MVKHSLGARTELCIANLYRERERERMRGHGEEGERGEGKSEGAGGVYVKIY